MWNRYSMATSRRITNRPHRRIYYTMLRNDSIFFPVEKTWDNGQRNESLLWRKRHRMALRYSWSTAFWLAWLRSKLLAIPSSHLSVLRSRLFLKAQATASMVSHLYLLWTLYWPRTRSRSYERSRYPHLHDSCTQDWDFGNQIRCCQHPNPEASINSSSTFSFRLWNQNLPLDDKSRLRSPRLKLYGMAHQGWQRTNRHGFAPL